MVSYLLAKGADPTIKNKEEKSPLDVTRSTDVIRALTGEGVESEWLIQATYVHRGAINSSPSMLDLKTILGLPQ